jgi:hypothetical protein
MTKNLQEENKVLRNLEKSERHKLSISREFTLQQQNTISNLLAVKSMQEYIRNLSTCNEIFHKKLVTCFLLFSGENVTLLEHTKQLEATLADTKRVRLVVRS